MSSRATDLPTTETRSQTGVRTTEEWVAAFAQGWRNLRGADALIAHFRELLHEDVRLIQPQLGALVGLRDFEVGFVRPLFDLVPDLHIEVERWAVNGEDAFVELIMRGTLGGREIAWRACDRMTLRDGVLIERETYVDPAQLVTALARSPRLWPRFIRIQIQARIRARRTQRRNA
jgi:ketosteroid isomerase-like protein